MQNEVLDSLPNSSNEFMAIFKQSGSLEELLMATYSRAVQVDMVTGYKPIPKPYLPNGFEEAYARYRQIDKGNKSEAWKALQHKFYGYFKRLDEVEAINASNYKFLKEMQEFFKQRNMPKQANTCAVVMTEHEEKRIGA